MIDNKTLNKIGKLFIGDTHQIYIEKKGYQIVDFFNDKFGFNDVYGPGFPSKWLYTQNKLEEITKNNQLEDFINIILDKTYIMKELEIGRRETIIIIEEIISIINEWLYVDGYTILKKDNKYILVNIDKDLEYIGSGGFANVYKQKSTGKVVKKLNDDSIVSETIRSRFKREYEITKSIGDISNIINVYEFDRNDYSYTMEHADKTLLEYVRENELESDQKIQIIKVILGTMNKIHSRDIIHRDLSPKNVLLVDNVFKISDFGLGKDLKQLHSHLTILTNNYGQYDYCAPEQREMLSDGDKRSDVFSLGKLINFIMTGNPNSVNHFLRSIVEKATNNNPNYRYQNAMEMYRDTEHVIEVYISGVNKESVYNKLRNGIIDEEVTQYIYKIDYKELNDSIKRNYIFMNSIYKFIEKNKDSAIEIINLIHGNYKDVCRYYEDYDNFAKLSYMILNGEYEFEVNRLAAEILKYVATDVNRFSAQGFIEDLIEKGIDPIIEKIIEL